jgi:hypothetical protein
MPGNTSQGSVSRSKLFSLLFEISLFFFLVWFTYIVLSNKYKKDQQCYLFICNITGLKQDSWYSC